MATIRPTQPHQTQQPQQTNGGTEIDFSQLNLGDAGRGIKGLVFKPDFEQDLETRSQFNYSNECQQAINTAINLEFSTAYSHEVLYAYFNRDSVALPGFACFFKQQALVHRDDAHDLIDYQNKRGGRVELKPIALPEIMLQKMSGGVTDALYAMDLHLQLEKFIFNKLIEAHKCASQQNDPEMTRMLEECMEEQTWKCKNAADYVAQLRRIGTGYGVWEFDRWLRSGAASNKELLTKEEAKPLRGLVKSLEKTAPFAPVAGKLLGGAEVSEELRRLGA